MIYDYLVQMVGSVPSGLEDAVYVFSILVFIFLLCELFAFLHTIFRAVCGL